MKGKGLKLWQAIVLIFSSICLVSGGVVLYTYLTNGFGSKTVEAEKIEFDKNIENYNSALGQLEVDGDFSLTVNATNPDVTETELTLSFAKSSTGQKLETFVNNGVTYISNGIISIPQKATIGQPIPVTVDKVTYNYDIGSFDANAGGITTILAKSSNILDAEGSRITVAVDVPVEKIGLEVIDTTTGKKYEINSSNISKILQNTNFDINVKYYPTQSRYRYSDNFFKSFYGTTEFVERTKDYCYEISAGEDVVMNYNGGDVYFSTSASLTAGNKVNVYAFATAKKQEEFERSSSASLEGVYYYNAMLSFLAKSADSVLTNNVNFSIEQADVGNMYILNKSFEARTNRLFILTAKNAKVGNGTLDLNISNEEGESLASMISQVGLKVRYKKAGDADFTDLKAGDNTVVIKSQDKILLGNNMVDNPYLVKNGEGAEDDVYYYFANTSVKDLKNAYWEISTNESSIVIEITATLFRTVDGVTSIFDINGDNLKGTTLTRTALINVTENAEAEGDVSWLSTNEQLNIVYNGTVQIPSQIALANYAQIPSGNTYQKVQYYIAKADGTEITTEEANISGDKVIIDGTEYTLLSSSDLLFKKAGTYYVMFATIRTDAYGKIIDDDLVTEGIQVKLEKKPQTPMTVVVNETLQSFQEVKISLTQENTEKYGVFAEVSKEEVIEDMADGETQAYYTYDNATYKYTTATILTPNKIQYYKLLYYAVETGAENAMMLDITVSESDTKMIETEISKEKIKFYAVSADGMNKIRLTVPTDVDVLSGLATENVITLPLSFPAETTIASVDGKGKGFYIVTEYDNSVELIKTVVEVDEYGKTITTEDEEINCFMLYTPAASKIVAPTYTYTPAGKDPITRTLGVLPLNAEISMNNQAVYDECVITEGEVDVRGGLSGDEWINNLLKKTKVLDAYGREYTKNIPGSSSVYSVSSSATSSLYIDDNEIKFASGKDKVTITVSTGVVSSETAYTFTLNTNSNGLGRVTIGEGADEKKFETFNNVYHNMNGEAHKGYTFDELVKIGVGNYYPTSDSYTPLSSEHTFFYIDSDMFNDQNLLDMFKFYNAAGSQITELNAKTHINRFELAQHFARNASIKFIVSSKDYSDDTDKTPEAIRFGLTINIAQHMSATVNFNDAYVYKDDDNAVSDGLYGGATYDLNQLVTLTHGNWSSGTYAGRTQYISENGSLSTTRNDATDIGTLLDGTLTLYDVASLKNASGVDREYVIKLFYYNSNTYAYNAEIKKFKIYPNIKLNVINDTLKYIEIANGALDNVTNHIEITRIRGTLATNNVAVKLLSSDEVVVINASNQFAYKTSGQLVLGYNQYEKAFSVGAYVGENQVSDKAGNKIERDLKLLITNDVDTFLEDIIYLKDRGATLGKAEPANFGGVNMLKVLSQVYYDVDESKHGETKEEAYYVDIVNANYRVHTFSNYSIYFNPAPDGYLSGENYYLNVYIYGVKTTASGEKDDAKIIATLKVPVYVSGVGSAMPYYFNYNEKINGFDINDLISGNIVEDSYAVFTAGQNVQIAYVDEGYSYIKTKDSSINVNKSYFVYNAVSTSYEIVATPVVEDIGTYYELKREHEGIYYDADFSVEISLDKNAALDQNEYAKITIQDEKYHIQFANLANEEKIIELYVRYSNGRNSNLTYVYKIKILPNMYTTVTYPFSDDSVNGAEFNESESSTEVINVDIADVFGQNAGEKADKTRFNLIVETLGGGTIDITEKQRYYVRSSDYVATEDGAYLLESGTTVSYDDGESAFVLAKDVVLSGIGETFEITHPTYGLIEVTEIFFTNVKYSIKEISVADIDFENFDENPEQEGTQNDVTYSVQYTSNEQTKKFILLAGGEKIGEITFTDAGILTLTKLNKNYFINLLIEKTYSNIVNSTSTYKYYINNTSGVYYIDYSTETEGVEIGRYEDLQVVSTEISTDAAFKLKKLYKTGEGSSSAEDVDEITYNASLKDRNNNVVDLSEAIEGGASGIVFTDVGGTTQWPYNLRINIKDFIDQDYTLELYFIAKIGNDSFEISKFIVTIKGSLVATARVDAPILNAGTIITAESIMSQYEFTIDDVKQTSMVLDEIENISDFNFINQTNYSICAVRQSMHAVRFELVLVTSEGTSYITLPFDIAENIAQVPQVKYETVAARSHYAGQTGTVALASFYILTDGTGLGDGEFELSYRVPTTFEDYIEEIIISGPNVEFTTNNVAYDIENVRIELTFTYTYGTYSFELTSTFVFDILANSGVVATYPDPDADGTSVEYESVYFSDEYTNFFDSEAPFATGVYTVVKSPVVANIASYYEQTDGVYTKTRDTEVIAGKTYYTANFNRIQITDLTGVNTVDKNSAIITIKETYGVLVYAGQTYSAKPENFTKYFTYNGSVFTQCTAATEFNSTTVYYLLKADPANVLLDGETIEGLGQTIVFKPYASYEDGYVIFEIEYNAVKTEYKVYAFTEIVEAQVVNSVTSMNGTEEIFLEQVEEGNILAENTVAKIYMDPVLPSGTYYIKLNNPGDSVNPYHWVGFKYDATKTNEIFVYLGEVASLTNNFNRVIAPIEENLAIYYEFINGNYIKTIDTEINADKTYYEMEELKGYIIGLYSSKTAPVDLRTMEGTTTSVSLTSFVNLRYVTVSGDSKTTQEINRDYDYTSLVKALNKNTDAEYALNTIIYKVQNADGSTSYYTKNGETLTDITGEIDTYLTKKILLGEYKVYDNYITLSEDDSKVLVTNSSYTVTTSGEYGFGQVVTYAGELVDGTVVYALLNDLYINETDVKYVYDLAANDETIVYEVSQEEGSVVYNGTNLVAEKDTGRTDINLTNKSVVYDDEKIYYLDTSKTKYNDLVVYDNSFMEGEFSSEDLVEGEYALTDYTFVDAASGVNDVNFKSFSAYKKDKTKATYTNLLPSDLIVGYQPINASEEVFNALKNQLYIDAVAGDEELSTAGYYAIDNNENNYNALKNVLYVSVLQDNTETGQYRKIKDNERYFNGLKDYLYINLLECLNGTEKTIEGIEYISFTLNGTEDWRYQLIKNYDLYLDHSALFDNTQTMQNGHELLKSDVNMTQLNRIFFGTEQQGLYKAEDIVGGTIYTYEIKNKIDSPITSETGENRYCVHNDYVNKLIWNFKEDSVGLPEDLALGASEEVVVLIKKADLPTNLPVSQEDVYRSGATYYLDSNAEGITIVDNEYISAADMNNTYDDSEVYYIKLLSADIGHGKYIPAAKTNTYIAGLSYYVCLEYDENTEVYSFDVSGTRYCIDNTYDAENNILTRDAVPVLNSMITLYVFAAHCGEATHLVITTENTSQKAQVDGNAVSIFKNEPVGYYKNSIMMNMLNPSSKTIIDNVCYITISGTRYILSHDYNSSLTILFGGNEIFYKSTMDILAVTIPTGENHLYFMVENDLSHANKVNAEEYITGDSYSIVDKDGNKYVVSGTKDELTNKATIVLSKETSYSVYKEETTTMKFAVAEDVGETTITAADGKTYYEVTLSAGDTIYVEESQINTYSNNDSDEYYVANLETFTINDLTGLMINDEVELTFEYVLGSHIGEFKFRYKVNVDIGVQNAIDSTNEKDNSMQMDVIDGEGNAHLINYIEIETNRDYDFNALVGAIRTSSGEVLAPEDIRPSANMKIEVVKVADISADMDLLNSIKNTLGEELKDNSDVIRFSYELIKTNKTEAGVVYNFNVTPLGADNNGDFVLVKYTYQVSVGSFVWAEMDKTEYSITKYVLFKILPDYAVSMNDANGNPVLVLDSNGTKNNLINPIQVTNFATGEITETGKTMEEIASDTMEEIASDTMEEIASDDYYLKATYTDNTTDPATETKFYLITDEGNGKISYTHGFGKVYETDLVEGVYTSLKLKNRSGDVTNIIVLSSDINRSIRPEEVGRSDGDYIALVKVDAKAYVNVNLPISTTTEGSMLKVTASNAINSKKNISASVFNAVVESRETYDTKYIKAALEEGLTETANKIETFQKGVQLTIPQAVALGERRYKVTFTDKFNYVIELYFNLVAKSNPTYASGSLEYIEGHTFDIGAQYEVVNVGSYDVQKVHDNMSNAIFYPITYEKNSTIPAGEYYELIFTEESGTIKVGTQYDNSVVTDMNSEAKRVFAYNYVDESTPNFMKLIYVSEDVKVTEADGKTYYKLLNGLGISNTAKSYTQFNMPYGYMDKNIDEQNLKVGVFDEEINFTTIYLTPKEFILVDSSMLSANAGSLLTSVGSPNIGGQGAPIQEYDGTLVLGGINAFGFAEAGVDGGDETSSVYFKEYCDLDHLVVSRLDYVFDGYVLYSEDVGDWTEKNKSNICDINVEVGDGVDGVSLASTKDVYRYRSDSADDVIGRYINQDQFKIPTMPGWIYGDKDYAYVDLVVTIMSNEKETYSLPITIKVTKSEDRIISTYSKATNVSDDTAFTLSDADHVDINGKKFESDSFYDDTVAVTLPATGNVKVTVEALRKAKEYYSATGVEITKTADNLDELYFEENGEYFKAYFTGSTVLTSKYGDMDYTYYVGLSRTVGHTLDVNYDVTITFDEYNTQVVTRDGNIGFSASYGFGENKITTNGNYEANTTNIINGTDWWYAYDYGQIESNGNQNEFTLIKFEDKPNEETTLYYIPTEGINKGVGGASDVIKAGYGYIEKENRTSSSTIEKTLEIFNSNHTEQLNKTQIKWTAQTQDKLNLVDMGSLTKNVLKVTKYYLVQSKDGKTYQFVKDFNIYPKYFAFETEDVSFMVQAEANESSSLTTYTFDLSSWGNEISFKSYNDSAEAMLLNLNSEIDINALHFELGEEDTTNARIDSATGKLSVNASKYNINGEEYVTIKIYVKASGENATYVSDKISTNLFSGNKYNIPMITVKVYLNPAA